MGAGSGNTSRPSCIWRFQRVGRWKCTKCRRWRDTVHVLHASSINWGSIRLGRVRGHAPICARSRGVGQQNLVMHRGRATASRCVDRFRGRHDALAMSSCLSQSVPQPFGVVAGEDRGQPESAADRRAVVVGTVRTRDADPCRADAPRGQDVFSGSRPRFDPICTRRSPVKRGGSSTICLPAVGHGGFPP